MKKSDKNLINGYFFMSVIDGDINIDCSGSDAHLSAAFATIFVSKDKEGANVKDILATAAAIAATELHLQREKSASKKKNNPKQMDGTKSDEPFVKTRKKAKK
jgi:hypothetical protein